MPFLFTLPTPCASFSVTTFFFSRFRYLETNSFPQWELPAHRGSCVAWLRFVGLGGAFGKVLLLPPFAGTEASSASPHGGLRLESSGEQSLSFLSHFVEFSATQSLSLPVLYSVVVCDSKRLVCLSVLVPLSLKQGRRALLVTAHL